jgi:hypothetical protein
VVRLVDMGVRGKALGKVQHQVIVGMDPLVVVSVLCLDPVPLAWCQQFFDFAPSWSIRPLFFASLDSTSLFFILLSASK